MDKRNGTLKRITAFLLSVSMALTMFNVTDLPLINNGSSAVTASAEETTVAPADQKRYRDDTTVRMFYTTRPGAFGGVQKVTQIHVYAFAGETLEFGSNVYNANYGMDKNGVQKAYSYNDKTTPVGQDKGEDQDIVVRGPTGNYMSFDVKKSGEGLIDSVAKEKQALSGATGDYQPLTYHVTETGVYTFYFRSLYFDTSTTYHWNNKLKIPDTDIYYTNATGTSIKTAMEAYVYNYADKYIGGTGGTSNVSTTKYYKKVGSGYQQVFTMDEYKDGIPVFDPFFNPGWIAAWAVNVRDESGSIKSGRTYADQLSTETQGNIHERFFVMTNDNYLYKLELNGASPYTSTLFANNRGVMDSATGNILYKSAKDINNNSAFGRMGVKYKMPEASDTDLTKTFKIFFEYPSSDLEGILYENAILPDPAKNLSFSGLDKEGKLYAGAGGYFSFDVEEATTATIKVEFLDKDGKPSKVYKPAEITDIVTPYTTNSFYWNGKDGNNTKVEAGTKIKYSVTAKAGEIHFPIIDMELAQKGLTLTRVNDLYTKEGNPVKDDIYEATKSVVYYDETAIYYGENAASTGLSEGEIKIEERAKDTNNRYTLSKLIEAVKNNKFINAVDKNGNPAVDEHIGELIKQDKDNNYYLTYGNWRYEYPLYEKRYGLADYPNIRIGDHSHTNNPIDYFGKSVAAQQSLIDYLDSSKNPVGKASQSGTYSTSFNKPTDNATPSYTIGSDKYYYWGSTTDYAIANYWTFIPAQTVSSDTPIETKDPDEGTGVFALRGFVFFDEKNDKGKGVFDPLNDGDHELSNITLKLYKETEALVASGDKEYCYVDGSNQVVSIKNFADADGKTVYELVSSAVTTLKGDYYFTGLEYDIDKGTEYLYQVVRPDPSFNVPTSTGIIPATTDESKLKADTSAASGPYDLYEYGASVKGTEVQKFKIGGDGGLKPEEKNRFTVTATNVGYNYEPFISVTVSKNWNVDDESGEWSQKPPVTLELSYNLTNNATGVHDRHNISIMEQNSYNYPYLTKTIDGKEVDDYAVTAEYFVWKGAAYKFEFAYNSFTNEYSDMVGTPYYFIITDTNSDGEYDIDDLEKDGTTEGKVKWDAYKDNWQAAKPMGSESALSGDDKEKDVAPVVATVDYQQLASGNSFAVTNSTRSGVIEITKADSSIVLADGTIDTRADTDLLLSGAVFRLYEFTKEDKAFDDPLTAVKNNIADQKGEDRSKAAAAVIWLNKHLYDDETTRSNGMLTFHGLDINNKYVIRELFAPAGYAVTAASEYRVVGPDDFKKTSNVVELVISNTKPDDNLTIRKVLSGRGWNDTDSFDFNIKLTDYDLSLEGYDHSKVEFNEEELGDFAQFKDDGKTLTIDKGTDFLDMGGRKNYSVKVLSTAISKNDFSWKNNKAIEDSDGDSKITFPYPGTFTFKITEVTPAEKKGGITYSTAEYVITVTVGLTFVDEGKTEYDSSEEVLANLNPTVTSITRNAETVDAVQFTNTYSVAELDSKTSYYINADLTGRTGESWLATDKFNFTISGDNDLTTNALKEGHIKFKALEELFDKDTGTYNISIDRNTTDSQHRAYSVELEDIDFSGVTFEPDSDGSGSKPLEYTFEIKQTIPADATGNVYQGITYDDTEYTLKAELYDDNPDTTHIDKIIYTLTNETTKKSYTCTVTYKDNGEIDNQVHSKEAAGHAFTFTNTYATTAEWSPLIAKTLEGRPWHEDDSFTFRIRQNQPSSGTYGTAGGVKMPSTGTSINIKKPTDGSKKGQGQLGTITFTQPTSATGDNNRYYRFTISETHDGTGGIEWANDQIVYIRATDNLDGTLNLEYTIGAPSDTNKFAPLMSNTEFNFINTYSEKGTLTLDIEKALQGRAWTDRDSFTFNIDDSTNSDKTGYRFYDSVHVRAATIDDDGSISGEPVQKESADIVFTKPGKYTFTVSERSGTDKNIVYDGRSYKIDVDVTNGYDTGDIPNGKLNVSASYVVAEGSAKTDAADEVTVTLPFTNKAYAEAELKLNKTLSGRDWNSSDIFNVDIALTDGDENAVMLSDGGETPFTDEHLTQTAELTDSGRSIEKTLRFYKAGTYTFEITEKLPDGGIKDNVTYDNNTYTLTVTVTDNGEGELVADCEITGGDEKNSSAEASAASVTFVNTYSAVGYVRINKTMSGREKLWNTTAEGGINDSFAFTASPDEAAQQAIDASLLELRNDGEVPIDAYDEQNGDPQSRYDYLYIYAQNLKFQAGDPGYVDGGYYEYKFIITEQNGGKTIDGITYDESKYTVTVKITKNTDNTFKIEPVSVQKGSEDSKYVAESSVSFANTYTAKGTADFEVSKTLNGRDWITGDEFNFTVTEDTKNPATAVITTDPATAEDKPGKISITLDKAGEYNFTVAEDIPNGDKKGITYDKSEYKVTLTATDNDKGTLNITSTITKDGESADEISFTNSYSAKGTYQIRVHKELTGREGDKWLAGDKFSYKLSTAAANVTADKNTIEIGSTSDEHDGVFNISLDNVTYNEENTASYIVTVKEDIPDGDTKGITYDNSTYSITLKIEEKDFDGVINDDEITAEVKKDGESYSKEKLEFANSYKAEGAVLSFDVTKKLEGRPWDTDDSFGFSISSVKYEDTEIESDDMSGYIDISDGTHSIDSSNETKTVNNSVTFLKAGSYEFIFSEVLKSDVGLTCDDLDRKFEVEVKDNNEGELEIKSVTIDGEPVADIDDIDLEFVNSYSASGTLSADSITVLATLTGRPENKWLPKDIFAFNIQPVEDYGGTVTLPDSIEISDKTDEHTNGFGEITFTGVTFDDDGNPAVYKFKVSQKYGGNTIYGVNYDPAEYTVTVSLTNDKKGGLKAEVTKVEKSADGPVSAAAISDGDMPLEFHNVYSPEDFRWTPTVSKVLNGRDWCEYDSFDFNIKLTDGDPDGVYIPESTVNINSETSGYNAAFETITFSKPGTYTFEISESESGTVDGITYAEPQTVTIEVTDNNEGSLVTKMSDTYVDNISTGYKFTNSYAASGKLAADSIKVIKQLIGRDWNNGDEFTFTIKAPSEIYAGDKITLPADVVINNGSDVYGEDGRTKGFGEISFDNITFAAGERQKKYIFTIAEEGKDSNGVKYDKTEIAVEVTLTDNLDGTLSVSGGKEVTFNNTYTASSATLNRDSLLTVHKTLVGRQDDIWLDTDSFDFTIKPYDDITKQACDDKDILLADSDITISGDSKSGEKTGKFGAITFNKAGTYIFEISEQSGDIEGITYDDTSYYLTVQVIDNQQGNLKFLYGKLTDKDGKNVLAISFENVYKTEGSWTPKAAKTLTGRDWNEKDSFGFNIELESFNGNNVPEGMEYSESITLTGMTAASGTKYDLPFSNITFTKTGEYVFGITEAIPDGADKNNVYKGIKYDDTKYLVTVTVTDDLKGKLTAKSDISADFINTYSASGKIVLPVTKTFTGRANNEWFDSDIFSFNAVAYNAAAKDAVLAEKMFFTPLTLDGKTAEVTDGTASGDIGIELENIEFAAGENSIDYEFTVKEKQGGIPGTTYDNSEYHAYVTVTDKTDGTLDISVSYKLEEAVDGIEFTNVYSTKPAAVEFDIEKTLIGRPWQDFDSFDFELAGENIPDVDISAITDKSESSGGNSRHQAFGFDVNAGDSFSFTVSEKVPKDKLGLTYSDKEYNVTVTGTDNTKGQTIAKVTVKDKDNVLYSFDTSQTDIPEVVLSFVNSYEPVLVSDLLPKISKTLNGRRWLSTDKFMFDVDINGEGEYVTLPEEAVVTGEGVPRTQNTVSTKPGSVTFSPSGEEKTLYEFIISEKDEEDDKNNNIYSVSYDKSEYVAEVLFTDDFKGSLTAKLTKLTQKTASDGTESGEVLYSGDGDIPTLGFENIYTASGTWPPVVKKTLTGRDFDENDKFIFHISLEKWPDNVNLDEVGMPDDLVIQLSDGVTDGYITKAFDAVEFSKPGEYVFSVTEKTDGETIRKGVDYDKTKYQIILQVTDKKLDGVLSYEPENVTVINEDGTQDNYSNTKTLDFENIYNANGSWSPVIRKTLTGRKWQSFDRFEFALTLDKAQGADISTVTYPESLVIANKDGNSNSYTEVFDNAVEFTKPGIFTFTIEEKAGGENNGIDYDSTHKYTVTVTVTDENNDGVLTVKADNTAALEFENSYSATGIWPPKVTKTLTGRKWDGEYDKYSFGITLDKAPDGVDISGFTLPADLVITKGGQDAESYTGQFDNVVFSTPGEYVFSIFENDTGLGGISYDDSVYTLTVYVLDEGNGRLEPEVTEVRKNGEVIATDSVLEFTNEYYADTTLRAGTLRTRKLFTGRNWLESDKFGFTLTPADEVTKQAVTDGFILLPDNADDMVIGNDTDNLECEIGDIIFKSNGEEQRVYTFTVTEKDTGLFGVEYAGPVDITVTVTDDMKGELTVSAEGGRNGLLTFRNVYSASGEAWPPKVNAKLVGRDWTDKDSFTYSITLDEVPEGVDIDSITLPPDITVKKGEQQSDFYGLGFDQVIFNNAGLYTFTVRQKSGDTPGGVEYSAQEYTIELYVSDDNEGHLSAEVVKITDKDGNVYLEDELLFENTYSARQTLIGEEELTVTKNLSGRDWKTGDVFAFELQQLSGPKEINVPVLLIEGRDGENGAISGHFEDITFTTPGEYQFEVKETGGTSAGITFDKNTYKLTVIAEDNGDGSMTLTVSGNDDISFTNTYKAAPVTVKGDNFTITKSLSGREWKAEDSFEFAVTDSDTLSGEIITISGSDSEKSKHLSDMEFTEPGDHSYTVTETKGSDENITYDDKSYRFNVTVTDDGNGKLNAQISGDTEMLFTNVYNEPQTSEPETSAPTSEPETSAPTSEPETSAPTSEPETSAPTSEPETSAPTSEPETSAPTSEPETSAPTSEPETSAPTSEPETSAPTSEPETSAPTSEPETSAPTSEPETSAPTSEPETSAPTSEPETSAPTSEPETSAPTSEPETSKPTDTDGDATAQPDDKDNNPSTGIRLDVTAALITGSAFSLTAIVFRRKSKKDKK